MSIYNHHEIESRWNKEWKKAGLYKVIDTDVAKKIYVLDMFPYPSGTGLHVGHPKGYIATDIYSRMKRMQGYSVLHPMGWDAFGLPAENFALKNKIHPKVAVDQNIATYKKQLERIGFNYDWDREINTTDPEFYQWTQWVFLKMFEKGLAYESYEPINWCPSCKTGLANEDLEGGLCERCGSVVEQKKMRQWVIQITNYAERLLEGLDDLTWPESIKESQRNWIGKSEGAEFDFCIERSGSMHSVDTQNITVFTTRPDTLYGVTYVVIAPEHQIVKDIYDFLENKEEVDAYQKNALTQTEIERTSAKKEKTGIQLKGVFVIHPATKERLPIFIADYVLAHYGSGAVMGVPAHDVRDFEFANKYHLPIITVVQSKKITESTREITRENDQDTVVEEIKNNSTNSQDNQKVVFVEHGFMINSGEFDNLNSEEAGQGITQKYGRKKITYKLRDWVFARQRYWGEPIPIIHCDTCGTVAVPERDLPVMLPQVDSYESTETGESPLAHITDWVHTTCPSCNGSARRETNTMPQWAGSSWYYLRYIDPKNQELLVDPRKEKLWMSVDLYVGGAEHATRHLIYARFWHKFLYDIGIVSTQEPFTRLEHVGLILASDGRKMSKRFGNVINPDEIVETVGADALRIYEMFMGPFSQAIAWDLNGIAGARRFIERTWRLLEKVKETEFHSSKSVEIKVNQTIKKVGEDIEAFKFNTAISTMMECLNLLEKEEFVSYNHYDSFIRLLAPFAPYVMEELWSLRGYEKSIHVSEWPTYDPQFLTDDVITFAIQVNGKVRSNMSIDYEVSDEELKTKALELSDVQKWIHQKNIVKVIVVPKKIINIVVSID